MNTFLQHFLTKLYPNFEMAYAFFYRFISKTFFMLVRNGVQLFWITMFPDSRWILYWLTVWQVPWLTVSKTRLTATSTTDIRLLCVLYYLRYWNILPLRGAVEECFVLVVALHKRCVGWRGQLIAPGHAALPPNLLLTNRAKITSRSN